MTSSRGFPPELVCRLEAHAVRAWPATVSERVDGGWVLRATPGLDRGRSNHALTPCRELDPAEIPEAIARVEAFARQHRIHAGIQVSPVSLHAALEDELDRRGWGRRWPVLVLAAGRSGKEPLDGLPSGEEPLDGLPSGEEPLDGLPSGEEPPEGLPVERTDRATPEWLAAWARCEPGRDVESHARTVFPLLAGRATFARLDDVAVGIAVEEDGVAGLFCLAVDPERRRSRLGTAMVRSLLAGTTASTAYLQVEESNVPAISLYARLGFTEAYRYRHRIAPD